jgi:phospholipid/cholesterol/gamma-HCH transport system permease protein
MMSEQPQIILKQLQNDILFIHLSGDWNIRAKLPSIEDLQEQIEKYPGIQQVIFGTENLSD